LKNYFRDAGSTSSPWDKGSIRIDHTVNSRNRLSGLFLKGRTWPGLAPMDLRIAHAVQRCAVTTTQSSSLRISLDTTLTPRIINTFRGSYQKEAGVGRMLTSDPSFKFNESSRFRAFPVPTGGLPQLSFTAYTGWGGAFWGGDAGGNFNVSDDITFVRDKHTIKTGFF